MGVVSRGGLVDEGLERLDEPLGHDDGGDVDRHLPGHVPAGLVTTDPQPGGDMYGTAISPTRIAVPRSQGYKMPGWSLQVWRVLRRLALILLRPR